MILSDRFRAATKITKRSRSRVVKIVVMIVVIAYETAITMFVVAFWWRFGAGRRSRTEHGRTSHALREKNSSELIYPLPPRWRSQVLRAGRTHEPVTRDRRAKISEKSQVRAVKKRAEFRVGVYEGATSQAHPTALARNPMTQSDHTRRPFRAEATRRLHPPSGTRSGCPPERRAPPLSDRLDHHQDQPRQARLRQCPPAVARHGVHPTPRTVGRRPARSTSTRPGRHRSSRRSCALQRARRTVALAPWPQRGDPCHRPRSRRSSRRGARHAPGDEPDDRWPTRSPPSRAAPTVRVSARPGDPAPPVRGRDRSGPILSKVSTARPRPVLAVAFNLRGGSASTAAGRASGQQDLIITSLRPEQGGRHAQRRGAWSGPAVASRGILAVITHCDWPRGS